MPDLLVCCLIVIAIDNKMMRAGDFITKHSKNYLKINSMQFYMLSFFQYYLLHPGLSVALVTLVTLRKGAKAWF